MSDLPSRKQYQSAYRLIQALKLQKRGTKDEDSLEIAMECIDAQQTRLTFLKMNEQARKAVIVLYKDTSGEKAAMWNHVLGLINDYEMGRRR